MSSQVNKLTNLIDELLDVTKLQKGKLEYNESFLDFNDFVNEVINDMQRTTTTHTLNKNLGGDAKVYCDKNKMSQVLTNLISNAIKYSPNANSIQISTAVLNEGVQLSVKDHGIGIPIQEKQKVFEQFYRVDGGSQSTFPGMGIGLYICAEIIKRQHGKIWVDSEIGKGSTFHIWLPFDHKNRNIHQNPQ